jgi:hypothetical protein
MRRITKFIIVSVFAFSAVIVLHAEEPRWAQLSTTQVQNVQEPFRLGHRTLAEIPVLTDEELSTPQQQALLMALGGDPLGHRAGDHYCGGHPTQILIHAIPSNTCHYGGYQVGGGAPCKGEGPYLHEGTFGWDYFGILFEKRVALNWWHGAHIQGGFGAYKTDGPKHE